MGKKLRWTVFLLALLLGGSGFGMMVGGLVSHAASLPGSSDDGDRIIAFVGTGLFALSWLLGMLSFPTFTAISGAVLVPIALAGAFICALVAGVLARSEALNFDTSRASSDAWLATLICLLTAGALAANFAVWMRRRMSHDSVQHVLRCAAIGWGSFLFLSGLATAVQAFVNIVKADGAESEALKLAITGIGGAVIYLGAGGVLVSHGAGALTGVRSERYRPFPFLWPVLAFAAAVGLGALLLQTDTAVGLVPLLHAVGMIAPALAILALVSAVGPPSRPQRSTWREILLMLAYGSAVAASIAAIVNTLAFVGATIIILIRDGSFDGVTTFAEFADRLRDPTDALGKGSLLVLLLSVIALIGPLNEEFWKSFGVRLLRDHRPSRYQAFLWGVASGVGFGIVEANEYSASALFRSPFRWWDTILLRGGSSSLHALASGVAGIAWFHLFAGQKLRFAGLFALAVGIHGSWNALNVLTALRVLPWFKSFTDKNLEIALEIFLGLLALAIIIFLQRLATSLAAEDVPPAQPPLEQAAPQLAAQPSLS
jgi:hypothetical protein